MDGYVDRADCITFLTMELMTINSVQWHTSWVHCVVLNLAMVGTGVWCMVLIFILGSVVFWHFLPQSVAVYIRQHAEFPTDW